MTTSAMTNQDYPERHMCHCGKGFLRKEHLTRHQATHGKRAYICEVCQRSFTRSDLLRRHATLHTAIPVSTTRSWRACDACHHNKTKCDGSQPCALCVKRGVSCTYDRSSSTGGPLSRTTITTATTVQNESGSNGEAATDEQIIGGDAPPRRETSSWCGHRDKETCCAAVCLSSILKAVSLPNISGISCGSPPAVEAVRSWMTGSINRYFGPFHERWPVIHGPIFDERTDDACMVGTVVLIGCWVRNREALGGMIVEIHERLVQHFMSGLVSSQEQDDQEPWPCELYQASVLNAAFAYETGIVVLAQRARRLLALVVTALRNHGAFNPDMIEHNQTKHFPGTFAPWVHMGRSQWSRLAASLLKVDVGIAMFLNQPPLLEPEELELSIPCTFSLAHAYGIPVFFRRYPQEPPGREGWPMAKMACSPPGIMPPWLVIEDIQIGLCGLYKTVWRATQTYRCKQGYNVPQVERQLTTWKDELDRISQLWSQPEKNSAAVSYLLKVYCAKEETDEPGWETAACRRIASIFSNLTMLYHLLSMYLYAEIRLVALSTIGSRSLGHDGQQVQDYNLQAKLLSWSSTYNGRSALIHAISTLRAYEKATTELQPESIDPTSHAAASTAAMVAWAWMNNTKDECACGLNLALATRSFAEEKARRGWASKGGHLKADNVPLCRCARPAWMDRFVRALGKGGGGWEGSGVVVRKFGERMTVSMDENMGL